MKNYRVIYSYRAVNDLDSIVLYIANLYRLEAGLQYKNRIMNKLDCLAYCADAFPKSHYKTALLIHPEAKTLSIMNHRWTAIYHVKGDFVFVERIIPSKMMIV